jgi:hypothetical protein
MIKKVSRCLPLIVGSLLSLSITQGKTTVWAQAHPANPPYTAEAPVLFDGIPNWGLRRTITAVRHGSWNSAGTWSPARMPTENDIVLIPGGVTVQLDGDTNKNKKIPPMAKILVVSGVLRFSTSTNTKLVTSTILVRPDGTLQMSPTQALSAARTQSIVFKPANFSEAEDPEQHANGLIILGKMSARGLAKTSFVRLGSAPMAGQTTLSFKTAVKNWRAGDKIAIPDTSVASNGLSARLSAPLRYNHAASPARPGEAPFVPHVMNLSRNIVLSSDQPNGVRGHVYAGGSASVDIEDVAFVNLGRTTTAPLNRISNHIGRYSLHLHHCSGPITKIGSTPYRARVIDCAFDGGQKWLMSVHASSKARVEGNVFFGAKGAGFVAEDGNERENEIVGNIAANIPGSGEPEPGQRTDPSDFGSEGTGFWFSGNGNFVNDNVAADCGLAGLMVFTPLCRTVNYPMTPDAKPCCFVHLQFPQQDFIFSETPYQRNESYGSKRGLEFWWQAPMTVKDSTAWNCHIGFQARHCAETIIDGLVVRGTPANNYDWGSSMGLANFYYPAVNELTRLDIYGTQVGIYQGTSTGFQGEGVWARVSDTNITNSRFQSVQNLVIHADMHYKKPSYGPTRTYLRTNRFERYLSYPLKSVESILGIGSDQNMIVGDEIWIENYQGAGSNWRLYYETQAPNVIVPHSSPDEGKNNLPAEVDFIIYHDGTRLFRIKGTKEPNLTNAQSMAKYGLAIGGSIAPPTRHPDFSGFAENVSSVPVPSPAPINLAGSLDIANGRMISGWVFRYQSSRKLKFDVLIDGVKRGEVVADIYRADLNRRIAYQWEYPAAVRDGKSHEVKMVLSNNGAMAPGFPIRVVIAK